MAASLPLPWLCAHIAVDVLAEIQSTDRVLIIGATGAIGSAVCQMLQHRQVSALYGTTRRNTSQQERENGGSDQTHATLIQLKEDLPDQGLVEGVQRASASAASPSPNAGLLDVIIDCSGQEVPVNAALSLLSPGGHSRLIMMATANQTGKFNIDMRTLYMKSVTLKGLSSNVLNGVQVAKALDGVRRGFEEGLYHTGDRSRVDEVELVKGSELLQNALQKSISSGRRLVLTM
jgi:NADPH:quinone reductase-like Zn-dependent oxidoreductase